MNKSADRVSTKQMSVRNDPIEMKSFYEGESVPSLSIYSRQSSNRACLPDLSHKSAFIESPYLKTAVPLV